MFSTPSLSSYIPKEGIQQSQFLSKYPKFDGRGIIIAIIDCGIDVSHEGLQKTSEGLPKILDCFDFTGVGDVNTCEIREMDSNNALIGLSGRKLKIPKKWINPSGEWHIGIKSLYKPSIIDKITFEKLPEMDCIVWFDGKKWLACIDDTFGNLEMAKVLTNFRDDQDYSVIFWNNLKIPYCITIRNDGNLLEILTPFDSHGSVVAEIAAAHFPQTPERDGLAPGAQLISMRVFDPGVEHYVNTEAIYKAFLKCIEMRVDIINISLGFNRKEEISHLANEMINKNNILIFQSAGNRGPFYKTVDKFNYFIEDATFTIGAVLTADMKKRIYNIPRDDDDNSPIVCNLSSRGPGANGSKGLDFVAPGAVIARYPRFTNIISKYRLCNGTSFSAPNAAGAVACLLSALKGNSIQYSPFSIKFVLFKTALLPENGNQFQFGHGIIQIDAAFDYYCKTEIDYKGIPKYSSKAQGIVFVEAEKVIMERKVDLSTFIEIKAGEASKKWTLRPSLKAETYMKIPSKIDKNNSFLIEIDTNKLEPGSSNLAEILIMEPSIGSILSIPVNRPVSRINFWRGQKAFGGGKKGKKSKFCPIFQFFLTNFRILGGASAPNAPP